MFNLVSTVTFRDSEIVGNRAVGPIGIGGGIFNVFGQVNLHTTRWPTTSPPSRRAGCSTTAAK